MKLLEYQAKELLKKNGIKIPEGFVIRNKIVDVELPVVGKVQIYSGGRGKAGGVKLINKKDELIEFIDKFLGKTITTYQSKTPEIVEEILLEKPVTPIKELYIGITYSKKDEKPILIFSPEGGVDIEEAKSIKTILIDSQSKDYKLREFFYELNLDYKYLTRFIEFSKKLIKIFFENDLTLLEINPLGLLDDDFIAMDCKIIIDDNAVFRNELFKLRRFENPLEKKATEVGISYVKMDGNIGCLVNGAGLAMAVMDILKYYGGNPANFLDVGGGANEKQVYEAFKILFSDKDVKVVYVNIFGGIMRCDIIANNLIKVIEELNINIPIVVRLQGTNYEEAKEILNKKKEKFIVIEDFTESAKKAVELSAIK
ncbi:MAG: ADP-forming succinate--CoA ligase subunit beta [bacterium]|nr:ADP-forming succinate--CoA ligase subunit beta [bacterium]